MKQVAILLPTNAPRAFDYGVPEGMEIQLGDVVRVPIGAKETLGVVWAQGEATIPAEKLKYIIEKYALLPSLSEDFRNFLDWAAWYNGANKGALLKMVLPLQEAPKKSRVQFSADDFTLSSGKQTTPNLSSEQQAAATILREKLHAGFGVSVLDGVTGSGKTEVYFDAIASLLNANNSQILVLLPEIALSVQWLSRFEKRFGMKPVVWHSNITPAKRRASWNAIASGEARVIVGARSALFLPYKNLQYIIVDEEHDGSYKQEEGVHYHARDMAIARAQHAKIPVLLVSATPSLETVHNMRLGRYTAISLPMRHNAALLPYIHLLDMRKELLDRGMFISSTLREAIADALRRGEQAILFLNRRGYAPLVLCRACGHRFQCPDCSSWLVLHGGQSSQAKQYLQCHHCNYRVSLPPACPACKAENNLHACGPGVERVFEEISALMPQARIATLASDSNSPKELTKTIDAMGAREIDILIGTQMIAKGHHFAGVTVVGVVDADLGLMGGDLRAAEKTYQLLHQIAGRAGREALVGHVYLQSYTPDHPVMQALAVGERDAFFTAELAARESAQMPPFSRLAAVIIEGRKEAEVVAATRALSSLTTHHSSLVTIYGPAPAPLFLLRGHYRYRFLLKAPRNVNLSNFVKDWVTSIKLSASVKIKIDIDPMSFM